MDKFFLIAGIVVIVCFTAIGSVMYRLSSYADGSRYRIPPPRIVFFDPDCVQYADAFIDRILATEDYHLKEQYLNGFHNLHPECQPYLHLRLRDRAAELDYRF